jgi:alanine-glyoxylate transaminase/serine-glyoxylate transaminase/serine-pyruvate transaminase
MSLKNGRSFMAIPGPSEVPDRVLQAMHRGTPDIYAGELPDMMAGIARDLRYVAQTDQNLAIYICNGHGTWEAALANTLQPGDKVLVPATGTFGHSWANAAQRMGIETQMLDHGRKAPVDPEAVRRALEADKTHELKALLVVHVDTSTSVRSDIAALRAVLDDLKHPALLLVDCIASMGCDEFRMDAWGADVAITASQKGLMVPAGLGFVFFSDRASERRKSLTQVSGYWDWTDRAAPEFLYQYFFGTAPTHHLYGLRAALDMIREEGIEQVWQRHQTLAQGLWAAVDHWGQAGPIRANIADPAHRSHAVTTVEIGMGNGDRLRAWCQAQTGVTLGIGLGSQTEDDPKASRIFRFGHMGHLNPPMLLGVLGTVEAGLTALDIPHHPGGVTAAAQAIARDLARV